MARHMFLLTFWNGRDRDAYILRSRWFIADILLKSGSKTINNTSGVYRVVTNKLWKYEMFKIAKLSSARKTTSARNKPHKKHSLCDKLTCRDVQSGKQMYKNKTNVEKQQTEESWSRNFNSVNKRGPENNN